ncbi:MAG: hypothetical protein KAS63_00865 [Candidatus Heimdallarchaeota archaeon]|nr:hypothetical protein [Candidatus Heimdallarchaeota archaeon]MCK4953895.1 hypothetical protein [Candidatus Heimdallarchaeota archaeon]
MSIIEWFENLPPASLTDPGLKMLMYLLIIFLVISALVVFFTTKVYKDKRGPSLLDLDLGTDIPAPTDIPPAERIAILKIEKAKFVAGQQALSATQKKKEISETIFGRLSVRYAADVKKIEDEIEKTTREAEVSQLEEELKKMQGDYLSKIKGDEKIDAPTPTPSTAPPAPPTPSKATPVAPPTPSKTTPPPPPSVGKTPPPQTIPTPPMPTAPPKATSTSSTPAIPAPTVPTPKPPSATGAPEGEGDLFAKSTSIAALRKEMLKELDRLKKFMSDQQ